MEEEIGGIVIDDCEVLLDSGNTACDLLLSKQDALKFQLYTSSVSMPFQGFGGNATVVKMLPALKVTFSLEDTDGNVKTKSASLDVWILESGGDVVEDTEPLLKKQRSDSESSSVPINKRSPVKHLRHGSANLGKSGCKKLKLKYDFDTDQISFLDLANEELPEI